MFARGGKGRVEFLRLNIDYVSSLNLFQFYFSMILSFTLPFYIREFWIFVEINQIHK